MELCKDGVGKGIPVGDRLDCNIATYMIMFIKRHRPQSLSLVLVCVVVFLSSVLVAVSYTHLTLPTSSEV